MQYMNNIKATVKKGLQHFKGQWPRIQRESGVSYSWIAHVANSHTKNPRIDEVQKVLDVLYKLHLEEEEQQKAAAELKVVNG